MGLFLEFDISVGYEFNLLMVRDKYFVIEPLIYFFIGGNQYLLVDIFAVRGYVDFILQAYKFIPLDFSFMIDT